MEGKYLKNHWSELRDRIGEWWDDLTDEDLDAINGNQDQLIQVLQERYGYTKSLAFGEVRVRMSSYGPKKERREKHPHRETKVLQHPNYENEDWLELNASKHPDNRKARDQVLRFNDPNNY